MNTYRKRRKNIDWSDVLKNRAYNIPQIAQILNMQVPAARRHVMYAYRNKILTRARRGRVFYYIVSSVLKEVVHS